VSLFSAQGGERSGVSASKHGAHECPLCKLWEIQDASDSWTEFHAAGFQPVDSVKRSDSEHPVKPLGSASGRQWVAVGNRMLAC